MGEEILVLSRAISSVFWAAVAKMAAVFIQVNGFQPCDAPLSGKKACK